MLTAYTTRKIDVTEIENNPVISFDLGAHWHHITDVDVFEHTMGTDYRLTSSRGDEFELSEGDWVTTLDLVPSPWRIEFVTFADQHTWLPMPLVGVFSKEQAIEAAEQLVSDGRVMRAYVWHADYSSPAARLGWTRMDQTNLPMDTCGEQVRLGTGYRLCGYSLVGRAACVNAYNHIG